MGAAGNDQTAAVERTVTSADTAACWGEEFPPAASTPFVLGLAEVACHAAVAAMLATGEITVGTGATVRHLAPSRIGTMLRAEASLRSREGRRLSFSAVVRDDDDRVVAEIEHQRAVVERDVIMDRLR